MFCKHCGAKLDEGARFCKNCGKPISDNQSILVVEEKNEEISNGDLANRKIPENAKKSVDSKWMKIVIPILLIVLVGIGIFLNRKPAINLEDYITISYEGYDGYATATYDIDKKLLYDYAQMKGYDIDPQGYNTNLDIFDPDLIFDIDKMLSQAQQLDAVTDELMEIADGIKLTINKNSGICNGDTLTVTIEYDNKRAKEKGFKFSGKKVTKTVEGLKPTIELNPFDDITGSIEGISKAATFTLRRKNEVRGISVNSFVVDKEKELKNGDIVTVSVSNKAIKQALADGVVLKPTTKTFTVDNLSEYVDTYKKLSPELLDGYKHDAEELVQGYFKKELGKEYTYVEGKYAGYIWNYDPSLSGKYKNSLYIVYKVDANPQHEYENALDCQLYFPVRFVDITIKDDSFSYNVDETEIVGASKIHGASTYRTDGYTDPYRCYKELAYSGYQVESGDGMEVFSEQTIIRDISDIPEAVQKKIQERSLKKVSKLVEEKNGSYLHFTEPKYEGAYWLNSIEKTNEIKEENRYIAVFSCEISGNSFETVKGYFPVCYHGLILLPDDNYILTATTGILGHFNVDPHDIRTRIKGYDSEDDMYDKVIRSCKDIYNHSATGILKDYEESEDTSSYIEYYKAKLSKITDETIASIVVGDYNGDGTIQAFAVTVPSSVNMDEIEYLSDMAEGEVPTSLYYLYDDNYYLVYEHKEKAFHVMESGKAGDVTALIVGCLGAKDPDRDYDGMIFIVKNHIPEMIGQTNGTPSIIDGYIYGSTMVYGEEGMLFHIFKYTIDDDKLVLIEEELTNEG